MSDKGPSEHVIQRTAVQWIRQWTPYVCFAIPNGENRSRVTGGRLKAEGVLAGVPDLCIPALSLFIEMKTDVGEVSPTQKEVHERLRKDGQTVEVCRSVEDVMRVVMIEMAPAVPVRQPLKKVSKK
jgi:hypothetical protein